ncbi:Phosphotyrosyl phosphatase activator [Gorgonomyces haynaldii]|nr:Phosphotyrosyl phosphatase activator [Gorgonomyces haynaldii]
MVGTLHKKILTKEDLDRFHSSPVYLELLEFLEQLNKSAMDKPITNKPLNPNVQSVVDMLHKLQALVDEIKPIEQPTRFGNPSFQVWYDAVEERIGQFLGFIGPEHRQEIGLYLLHSFGNRKRIDYGTGHELNFVVFLWCLYKIQYFQSEDDEDVVLGLFLGYIHLMRHLQTQYWLEPAGSHGVWGLDDYHFLPFYFGSGQLAHHKHLRPKSIHNKEIIEEFSNQYMYFECIQFINSVKTESLRWHSPMLDDISGVKTWEKVNQGMMKMYKAEVLGKLPIMQHFLFGQLLPFEGSVHSGHEDVGHDHVHAFGQEKPLCCSIRVPSSIAAVQSKPRPLPFD